MKGKKGKTLHKKMQQVAKYEQFKQLKNRRRDPDDSDDSSDDSGEDDDDLTTLNTEEIFNMDTASSSSPRHIDEDELNLDSDSELQEAFAQGLLKPGLNVITSKERFEKKEYVNDAEGCLKKLDAIRSEFVWPEKLDMVNKPAPLNPELLLQEEQHEKERMKKLTHEKNSMKRKYKALAEDPDIADDIIHNDFKREILFYRQAQSVVLEAIPKLHQLGIKTTRPEDYFAQMAKSDDHMHKIRRIMENKKQATMRTEKVRKIRELKKFSKQIQVEVDQNKAKDKRELLSKVNKYRKGLIDSLDFLSAPHTKPGAANKKKGNDRSFGNKRKKKDEKFGFGGQKKRSKYNTSENSFGGSKGGKSKGQKSNTRPGKERRKKMKSKS